MIKLMHREVIRELLRHIFEVDPDDVTHIEIDTFHIVIEEYVRDEDGKIVASPKGDVAMRSTTIPIV